MGQGRVVTATPEQVATAAAAVRLGENAALAFWTAAAARPGAGALVSLTGDPGTAGEGYGVPPTVPALRPAVRPAARPQYADLIVGGIGPGGYHGNAPGQASGALEGVPVARGDSILYIPVSPPAASRPSSLGSRLRGAWRALWGR
jgi:hypothetical protein